MSTDTVELFIPCEVMDVRVAVAPEDKLTLVEQRFIEALGLLGIDSIDSLSQMFGLGHRPTVDVVLGLWRTEYVEISEPGSVLTVSQVARNYLTSRKLGELPARTEGNERQEPVMRELVSGHFLEMRAGAKVAAGSRIAPVLEPSGIVSETGRLEMLEVLQRRKRETFGGRRERLMTAYVPWSLHGTPLQVRRRTIRVLARVWNDIDTDRVCFDIIHPTDMPVTVRRDIGARLSALSVERADEPFFKQLGALASKTSNSELTPEGALEKLEAKIAGTERIDPGNAPRVHEDCIALADTIEEFLSRAAHEPIVAESVGGPDGISAALVNAIADTQRQLVLVCPFVNVKGYQRLRDALARLLEQRDVDIFLLWGVEQASTLSGAVHGAFQTLQRNAKRGRLHFVDLPARTHAKIAIRDADWAMVGSYNFLSSQEDPMAEVAAVLRSPTATPARPMLALLEWASKIFPDYSVGRQVRTTAGEFVPSVERSADQPADEPSLRPATPGGTGSVESRASLRIWREDWQSYLKDLRLRVGGDDLRYTRVRIVENEDHRSWLWMALTQCKNSLFIASDGLTEDVVDERFVYSLRRRLEDVNGPDVTLVFHRASSVHRLQALAQAFPQRLHLVVDRNHAKILAWDNHALVSSFNFLSFEGVYTGLRGRRVRSEIGVLLDGPDVAHKIVGAVSEQLPEVRALQRRLLVRKPPGAATVGVATPSLRTPAGLVQLLQTLEGVVELQERGRRVRDHFAALAVRDAFDALERLRDSGIPVEDLELCAAAVLLKSRSNSDSESKARAWKRWLAARFWSRNERFEAAALLVGGDDVGDAHLPSSAVAELAALASVPNGDGAASFEAIASDRLSESDNECVSIIGAITTLKSAIPEGALALNTTVDAARPSLQPWLRAIYRFWERTGVALPLDELKQHVEARDAVVFAKETHARLLEMLQATRGRFVNFALGTLTWPELSGDGKPLHQLLSACEKSDVRSVKQWLERYAASDDHLANLMDRATERGTKGTKHDGEYIDAGRRRAYLSTLRDIARIVHEWVDAHESSVAKDSHAVNTALALGVELAVTVTDVREVVNTARTEGLSIAPLLNDLCSVVEPLLDLVDDSIA